MLFCPGMLLQYLFGGMQFFRKSAILALEQEYRRTEGPSLSAANSSIIVPESLRMVVSGAEGQGDWGSQWTSDLKLKRSPNSNVRALYIMVLTVCFGSDAPEHSEQSLLCLKDLLYNCQIPVYLASFLHYNHMGSLAQPSLIKKLLGQLLSVFSQSRSQPICSVLQKYPLGDFILLLMMRSVLFNRLQDIELLNFHAPIRTSQIVQQFEAALPVSFRCLREGEYLVDGRMMLVEAEEGVMLLGHVRKDLNQSQQASTNDGSLLEMSFSKDRKKITNVCSDARPAISEESHPTESDAESEVLCRYQIGNDSDLEPQPRQSTEYKDIKENKDHRDNNRVTSPIYTQEPFGPNYLPTAFRRNNNLLSGNPTRREDRSHDSKGRRVSLSKQRLCAKRKPGLNTTYRQAVILQQPVRSSKPQPSYYNPSINTTMHMDKPNVQFMYSNAAVPVLPPKSHSQQKRHLRLVNSVTTAQEQQKPKKTTNQRRNDSYDRSRLISDTRRRNYY